jgi:anaerobic selenocysteine-containing dehydrogenase
MLKVIVERELYDEEFVRTWCIGFDALQDHLTHYNLEELATVTGIPATTITAAAETFATERPSSIFDGNGLDQHLNVVQTVRALCILRAITGNIDVEGGEVFPDTLSRKARDIRLVDRLPADTRPLGDYTFYFDMARCVPPPPVFDALLTGNPYPVRAMIVQGGNPVVTLANTPKMEKALRRVECLVVMDLFMTRTAQLADFVLPAATFLETDNLTAYPGLRTNYPLLQQRVVDPVGEAWPDWKLWFELAKRLGFYDDFPWNHVDEAIDYQLEPTEVTARDLKGTIMTIPRRHRKFEEEGFFTPSKKVELFSERLARYGFDPLPTYKDPSQYLPHYHEHLKKYPLLGTSMSRTALYIHTQFRNIENLRRHDPEPLIFINPADAQKREIDDGAAVFVRSPLGEAQRISKVSDRIPEGVVALTWGWGESMPETGTNELVDDGLRDPMCGATSNRLFLCEISRA